MTSSDPQANPRLDRGAPAATGPGGASDAMSGQLARNWWLVALRGLLAIAFGVLAFVSPGATMLSLAILFAAYLLIDGAFGIVSGVRTARRGGRWGWLVAEGALNVVMAAVAFLFPIGAVLAFVLVTAAWSLLSGVALIVAAVRLRPDHGRWWMILAGAASVAFGVLLAISPLTGALVLTWWLGAYAVAFGAFLLALAFRLRARQA